MKQRKMQPRVMWAVLHESGNPYVICDTRRTARDLVSIIDCEETLRVVRVRVTEAP